MLRRCALIICDSLGIGAAPDAADYGDEGSHTLCHVVRVGEPQLPVLTALGIGRIEGVDCLPSASPAAFVCRLCPASAGKDTLTGHWELMGLTTDRPFPTYPHGFPADLMAQLEEACGRGAIGNLPASGTEIIQQLGPRQLRTGELIVYTSADSVLQIAAHEQVIGVDELYDYCRHARRICRGLHAVARIIARPFKGEPGSFVRTDGRRDFPLPPPGPLLTERMAEADIGICAVGKIGEIYSGRGLAEQVHTADNSAAMQTMGELWQEDRHQVLFANLIDFDTLYGHRNDPSGYAAALTRFDAWLGNLVESLAEDEAVMITADHGCDPTMPGTDHTREHVPMLLHGSRVCPTNAGTVRGLDVVGASLCGLLGVDPGAEHADLVADVTGGCDDD